MKKYKTSLYNIYVKLEGEEKKSRSTTSDYLLVHGYTGAMDHASESIVSFLRLNRVFTTEEELPFSETVLNRLIERGYITEKSPYEEREVVRQMAEVFHKRDSRSKSFLFLVAYDCNFRCPYCFENAISQNGKGWSKKVFTKTAVDRAYETMLDLEPDRNLHNRRITLYGGEPLLASNKMIVNYIVEKGHALGYTFKAITNGYDLECFENILKLGLIENLQITVDGSRDTHDSRRTHYQTGRSYDKIMENIGRVLKADVAVAVRINTDLNNFDEVKKVREHFETLGFFNYKKFRVYTALIHGDSEMNCNAVMACNDSDEGKAPVPKKALPMDEVPEHAFGPGGQYVDFDTEQRIFEERGEIIFHDEDELADEYNQRELIHTINRGKYITKHFDAIAQEPKMEAISCQDFGIRRKIIKALETRGLIEFRSVFCSAQTGMMIFDPYGDLYTCWETVGMDQHKVGSYRNSLKLYEEELEHWYGRNISKTPSCSRCKYAFFCGGGCQAHALNEGRGYNAPYCDGYPKTFHKVTADVYESFMKAQEV